MPLITSGMYASNDELPYEKEAAYYLNFYVISALSAIEYIERGPTDDRLSFENKYQFYHYHTDHLLYSVGQICNRLCVTQKDKGQILERKNADRANFQFSEEAFPILGDKRARNMVEHINEHNQKTISEHHGVGGFNVVDESASEELLRAVNEHRDTHPYTLDLIQREIRITRYKSGKAELLTVCIESLQSELHILQKNIKYFQSFLTFP